MKNKIKIITAVILSFAVVILMSPQVFLANTPRINPVFLTKLKNLPNTIASLPSSFFNSLLRRPSSAEKYAAVYEKPFYKLSDEVYAYEEGTVLYYDLKSNYGDYSEMTVQSDSGKTIKLRFPKDQPPVKEIIDLIKSQ